MSVCGNFQRRADIPVTAAMTLLFCLSYCLLIVVVGNLNQVVEAKVVEEIIGDDNDSNNNNNNDLAAVATDEQVAVEPGKHPVFLSELKLRNSVVAFNNELRQLKRDFVKDITDIYLSMKLDPQIGFSVVSTMTTSNDKQVKNKYSDKQVAALVHLLLAEEFADIVIKKHIIQRRLLAGLKVAFVKFLPLETVRQLVKRLPQSYGWLRGKSQVDLKPRFPEAKENQYVQLYSLIELRAKARAADDISALTSNNIKRILKSVQLFLIERKQVLPESELMALAKSAKKVLRFYQDEVTLPQRHIPEVFQRQLEASERLAQLAGGREELVKTIDSLINLEVLDIDLSSEADQLAAPPTINEQMIDNIERKWIPVRVLDWLEQDRKVLMDNEKVVKPLAYLPAELEQVDPGSWCEVAVNQVRAV